MSKGKYHYVPLKTILDSSSKYNNIFGVIRKYHEQGIFIRDETYDSIKVSFSATFDAILPHIKPGNIIRIHRLMNVGASQHRCIKIGDILLFSSFKDRDAATYKVRYEAKQPTLEMTDFARVAQLERWLASKLLEVSLSTITRSNWYDLVCEVVDIKDLSEHRVILVVYDATDPGLKFNWFTPTEQWGDYPIDKLACITAWDRHAIKARKLTKGSLIAFFNLQASEAKLQAGHFELHLRGGTHYGKMIRCVHPNSFLGVGFKTRMEKLMPKTAHPMDQTRKFNVPRTIIEEIPNSTSDPPPIILNQVDIDAATCDISFLSSSFSEESISPENPRSTRPSPDVPAKKMKLSFSIEIPVIQTHKEPEVIHGIGQYLTSNTDEKFAIKAKVMSYKPVSKNVIDLFQLVCPKCEYRESPSLRVIGSIKSGPISDLPCLDCQNKGENSTLRATFWVYLRLRDIDNFEIPVSLSKFDLMKLFNVSVASVLNQPEEAKKIFDFLDRVCPNNNGETASQDQTFHPYLKWIIYRRPGGSRTQWEYYVQSASNLRDNSSNQRNNGI